MARTSSHPTDCRQPSRKSPCCPDCGALECLCRPRFFAGQLLSEQDMNRLDQYIRNKHRLHNRNLHGWGVVNGLLVLCDPCGDVKVTQGYAVDPCGDDIVVCEETRVNICELIRKCRQAEPQPECQPFRQPPNSNCSELEEEWVLTVSYREWASRGVTALRGNSCGIPGCKSCGSGAACSCGNCGGTAASCSCGTGAQGKGGCSCGGGTCNCGKGSRSASQRNGLEAYQHRGAPQQCEPTVTCEGYAFGVYRKPEREREARNDDEERLFGLEGAFWDSFLCCARPLLDAIPPMPDFNNDATGNNPQVPALAASRWCCRFRDNLLKYFLANRNTSCEIIAHLRAVNCPAGQNSDGFVQDFALAFLQLLAAWAEGLKNCLCLSLLPPPPPATCDLRVPLATVRIRARDCQVLSICNWTVERKIMLSWPALAHWLSIVPIGELIRNLLDRLCCASLLGLFDRVLDQGPRGDSTGTPTAILAEDASVNAFDGATVAARSAANGNVAKGSFADTLHLASGVLAARFSVDATGQVSKLSQLMEAVLARGDEPLELGAVLNAASPRFRLPDNDAKLTPVEARNLPVLLLSQVLVKPLLDTMLGERGAAERLSEYQRGTAAGKTDGTVKNAAGDDDLRQQMETLRQQVQKQEALINSLVGKAGG